MDINSKGRLYIVSAPSGAGKTTLCSMLIKKYPAVHYSISYTTRKPHGNYYGTSQKQIEDALNKGTDIILDIDPQGAMQLKDKTGNNATYIFITAPSLEELKNRLVNRGTDKEEHITLRLNNAKKEMEYFKDYDYLIINDATDTAFLQLESIYLAEKLRTNQYKQVIDFMNI